MNLTGARWRLSGAEAVLRLRALRSSNGFDAYWKFHEQQEYERNHASHYADHRVPKTVPSAASSSRPNRPGTLKIVKKEGESYGLAPARLPCFPRQLNNPEEPHPMKIHTPAGAQPCFSDTLYWNLPDQVNYGVAKNNVRAWRTYP